MQGVIKIAGSRKSVLTHGGVNQLRGQTCRHGFLRDPPVKDDNHLGSVSLGLGSVFAGCVAQAKPPTDFPCSLSLILTHSQ